MKLSESEKNRIKSLYGMMTEQKKNSSNDPAALKYLEWRKSVESGQHQRYQDSTANYQLEKEIQLAKEKDEQRKKAEREKNREMANQLKSTIEFRKNANWPLSSLKRLELEMTVYMKNSLDPSSEEWSMWDTKFKQAQKEYKDAIELEKQKEEEEERVRLDQEQKEKERIEKLNLPLKKFVGKTVNVYNDRSQQKLYGKETIKQMSYYDGSDVGDRSGIYIYTQDGLEYELLCLSNPNRLADYLVLHKKYTSDYKYNSAFVSAVTSVSPNFCKKPKADFSVVSKPSSSNLA